MTIPHADLLWHIAQNHSLNELCPFNPKVNLQNPDQIWQTKCELLVSDCGCLQYDDLEIETLLEYI